MPLSTFADGDQETPPSSAQQIGSYYQVDDNTGKILNELSGDTQQSYAGGQVKVNKTITGTNTENVFDINLEVITKNEIKKTDVSPDAAVVLVIDTSGSMSYSMDGNDNGSNERINAAKKAAQEFINSFADAKVTDKKATRKVAIVSFAKNANIKQGWTDASDLARDEEQQCDVIQNLKAGGGTNMEAGLKKAKELLDPSLDSSEIAGINSKSIILLSDGVPTYYTYTDTDWWGNKYERIGGNGSETSHNCHSKVETVAKSITNANKYAIYIGKENDTIKCEKSDYRWPNNKCDLDKPIHQWLSLYCGFNCYTTDTATNLTEIFKEISDIIELQAQAWILKDPMGEYIKLDETTLPTTRNVTLTEKGFQWNLQGISPDERKDGEYIYRLTYQVKLDNLKSRFNAGQYYPTNGVTSLTYSITKEGETPKREDFGTAYFNIPSVKGFADNVEFTKVDESGNGLAGAEFTLTTGGFSKTMISGIDGKVSFANIPSGHSYTLKETKAPDGYIKEDKTDKTVTVSFGVAAQISSDGTIKNLYNKTNVTVKKNWDDNGYKDVVHPESISVQLLANGVVQDTVTLTGPTSSGNITGDDQNGKDETPDKPADQQPTIPDENQESADGDVEQPDAPTVDEGNTDKNTGNEQPIVSEEDGEETTLTQQADDSAPSVTISAASETPDSTVDTEDTETTTPDVGDWTYTWKNLPKYNEDGGLIVYTVAEDNVPEDYTATITGSAADGFIITNTYKATVREWTVNKVWDDGNNQDGKRPESIEVTLLANGVATNQIATLSANNDWTHTWTGLDVKDENDIKISYSVRESEVQDYTSSVTNKDGVSTITNTHTPETINIPVQKKWVDDSNEAKRPEKVTVQLLAGGNPYNDGYNGEINLVASSDWKNKWENVPKYAGGKEITYTVVEKEVAGYNSVISGSVAEGFTVTNTLIPEEKVTITVNKVWEDAGYEYNRPATITVNIKNGEEIADTVTLGNGVWSKVIELPEKDENGKDIVYAIEEASVPAGYTSTVNGYTITNTYTPDRPIIIPDPDVPLDPGPGPDEPDEPDEPIIDDPDVPLGPGPGDDTEIDEPDVPLAPGPVDTEETKADPDEPKTGDESPLMALTAMLVVSTGTLSTIIVRKKRKNEK